MFSQEFLNSELFNWVILPSLIFVSRMTDVTLGTIRHILIARGMRKIVPFLGFFEVLLWLFSIGQIMKNLNNGLCYFAWAGGFAVGIYVGMIIEERLALGLSVVRIISNATSDQLITHLRAQNIGVTEIEGKGSTGPVKIIFTVIKRKNLNEVIGSINEYLPNAFYSIEDIRDINQGIFAGTPRFSFNYNFLSRLVPLRKGK